MLQPVISSVGCFQMLFSITHRIHVCYQYIYIYIYMVTFTINIPPMLAYIHIYIYHTWILWVRLQPVISSVVLVFSNAIFHHPWRILTVLLWCAMDPISVESVIVSARIFHSSWGPRWSEIAFRKAEKKWLNEVWLMDVYGGYKYSEWMLMGFRMVYKPT